jgi:poly(3-hydroxybutyrate) depolymerase
MTFACRRMAPFVLAACAALASAAYASAQFSPQVKWYKLSPKSTFYRTNNDPQATDALAINMFNLPDAGGKSQILVIQVHGFYGSGKDPAETKSTLHAIFSPVDPFVLRPPSQQYRVPEAVDFRSFAPLRLSPVTDPTYHGALATELTNDFRLNLDAFNVYRTKYGLTAGPRLYVLFCVPDSYYSDNHDNNNDFGVTLRLDEAIPSIDHTGR